MYFGDKRIKEVQTDIQELTDGWNDFSKFEGYIQDLFERDQQDGFYGWNDLNYFLYEYELHLQDKAKGRSKTAWESLKNDSIEHVYPKESADQNCWIENFPNSKLDSNESCIL